VLGGFNLKLDIEDVLNQQLGMRIYAKTTTIMVLQKSTLSHKTPKCEQHNIKKFISTIGPLLIGKLRD
jgi:hypothetical protein